MIAEKINPTPDVAPSPAVLDLARQHLRRAIELRPDHAPYLYWLAQAEYEAGEGAAAQLLCQESLAHDDTQYEAWVFMAEIYLNRQQPGQSWKAARRAIRLDTKPEDAWLVAARAANAAHRPQKAIEGLTSYLQTAQAENRLIGPGLYRLLADSYLQAGQEREALDQWEQAQHRYDAFQIMPDAAFMALHARILRRLAQPEPALEAYRQALQLTPQDAALQAELGALWFEQADYPASLQAYRQALQLVPDQADYLYQAGRAARYASQAQAKEGSYRKCEILAQQAIGFLERATRLNDVIATYWYELAQAHMLTENWRLARQNLAEAINRSPAFSEAEAPQVEYLRLYAQLCLKMADVEGAREALSQVLSVLPDDHLTMVEMGRLSLRQGDTAAAYNYFRRAELLAPDEPRYLALMGQVLLKVGRLDEARELIEEAHTLAPEDYLVRHILGTVLLESGQTEASLTPLRQAVLHNPDNPEFRYWLGRAYWRLGQSVEAIHAYQEAVAGDPMQAHWHAELAELHLYLQQPDGALQSLRLATQLDSADMSLQYNLAIALANNGDVLAAIQLLKDRLETESSVQERADWHYLLGRLQLELTRLDEAMVSLGRAHELDPAEAIYKVDLARCLRLSGAQSEQKKAYDLLKTTVGAEGVGLRPFEELSYVFEASNQPEKAFQTLYAHLNEVLQSLVALG